MRNVIVVLGILVVLGAVVHGTWAERERRKAKRWQGIATLEESYAREEAVRLRLQNDSLESDLRLSKEKIRELESAIRRRKCASGELLFCGWWP